VNKEPKIRSIGTVLTAGATNTVYTCPDNFISKVVLLFISNHGGNNKTMTVKWTDFMDTLKEEVIEATQLYIAMNAPRAAMAVVSGIADPTELGLKEKLNAAKDLLDRAGLVKTDKVQIEAPSGIMILPAKDRRW
jgi:hypothetical protein